MSGRLIAASKFANKWMEAYTKGLDQGWVARELKMSEAYIRQKAYRMRRVGVPLPRLQTSLMAHTLQDRDVAEMVKKQLKALEKGDQ